MSRPIIVMSLLLHATGTVMFAVVVSKMRTSTLLFATTIFGLYMHYHNNEIYTNTLTLYNIIIIKQFIK